MGVPNYKAAADDGQTWRVVLEEARTNLVGESLIIMNAKYNS